MSETTAQDRAERWGLYELSLEGPTDGNPFLDVQWSAQFRYKNRVMHVDGFYDGEGIYRIRFMPDTPGLWQYVTESNSPTLDGQTGEFTCTEPSPGNHGPVGVRNTYHFAYADGTPYVPIGTTCYAWIHQGDKLEEMTLNTLRNSPFNKLRMCVFPKDYAYSKNEPVYYPFERTETDGGDFACFNPASLPSIFTYEASPLISSELASRVRILCLLTRSSLIKLLILPTSSDLTSKIT